ncbi:hypothetical protein N3K66_000536 [Trichothecium roseum]|uniref:Uncharacterized protein n=1 Tax=Trichothecium roseum TaxID=47278 RepID=A0ACC0VC96_9HYPO|nr:hypothetical protein N3K66_000536 [Trichothecium roseum]
MAPGTRRANRGGYVEHDDFEGLPVRQWRHDWVSVAPPEPKEQQQQNDIWDIELPHGMPKDSSLLPPHTQELLRAARSGVLYQRPPPEDDEADAEAIIHEKNDKKDEENASKGFAVKVWKQIPRNVEASGPSYLSSRRKNTVTIASKTVDEKIPIPTITKATVRRIDAAGNPYTEDVTLVEGQKIDGEIVATRVEAVPAPVAEAQAVMATPIRRRPPPPKRKAKAGPGRGKKKMKTMPSAAQKPVNVITNSTAVTVKPAGESEIVPKIEGNATPVQDSEMADDDNNEEEEDDDDDDDEGEEGEEADASIANADEREDQDKEMTDSTEIVPPPGRSDSVDIEMKDEATPDRATPPNPLTLGPPLVSRGSGSPLVEGSPLKNVTIPSPTEPRIPSSLPIVSAQPGSDIGAGSTAAGPPSAIVGEAPDVATDRDLPPATLGTEEALLPPPPEQVGNISSPKASPKTDDAPDKSSGDGKAQDEVAPGEEALPDKSYQDSIATEDSMRPDDSASTKMPALELGTASEAGAPPVVEDLAEVKSESAVESTAPPAATRGPEDMVESVLAEPVVGVTTPVERTEGEFTEPSEPTALTRPAEPSEPAEPTEPADPAGPITEPMPFSPAAESKEAQAGEPDPMDTSVGELDRQASADEDQPADTDVPPTEPTAVPEPTAPVKVAEPTEPVQHEEGKAEPISEVAAVPEADTVELSTTAPEEPAPAEPAPAESAPAESAPEEPAPEKPAPEEPASEDLAPKEEPQADQRPQV